MSSAARVFAIVLALAILLSNHSSGHDVITTQITFSREISRLLYNRCVSCHRQGGSAFSLVSYAEARPWAKAIEEEVLERRMPPWGAVKGFGNFRDDQALTQEQLELIADWVEGGAPEGDPKNLPDLPAFKAANPPARAPAGIAVQSALTLSRPIALSGVRVQAVPGGSSFMALAKRPDGAIEPLLWIYNYNARFDHPYWYTTALHLSAGTRIEITPSGAGGIALLTADPGRPRSR
jgi:hypothetical protein